MHGVTLLFILAVFGLSQGIYTFFLFDKFFKIGIILAINLFSADDKPHVKKNRGLDPNYYNPNYFPPSNSQPGANSDNNKANMLSPNGQFAPQQQQQQPQMPMHQQMQMNPQQQQMMPMQQAPQIGAFCKLEPIFY